MVKLMRATRQTSSAHPEYHKDTQRVMAEINALPAVERAWTMFFDHQG